MTGIILIVLGSLLIVIGIVFISSDSQATAETNLLEENIQTTNLVVKNPEKDIAIANSLPEKNTATPNSQRVSSRKTFSGLSDKNDPHTSLPQEETDLEHFFDLALADGVLTEGEKKSIKAIAQRKNLNYDKIIVDLESKLKLSGVKAETQLIDYNKQHGYDFEKYVVQKFDRNYFKIKEWTGDKYVDGVYAENTLHPDILLEFKLKSITKKFAVECKWKKELYKNGVEVANPEQLERYKQYEAEKGIPVFIILGIKNKGAEPEELFIIPLKELESTFLPYRALQKYRKYKAKNFFFSPDTEILS